jgi:hypothetical protein
MIAGLSLGFVDELRVGCEHDRVESGGSVGTHAAKAYGVAAGAPT